MPRHRLHSWQIASSIVLAAILSTVPADWLSGPAAAADSCTTIGEVRASTCRLVEGQTVEGTLNQAVGSATYRFDALAPDSVLELQLRATGGSTRLTVTDWRGQPLGTALRADDAPDVQTTVSLPSAGAFGVTVSGDLPPASPTFQLRATVSASAATGRAIWPPLLHQPDGLLNGERQVRGRIVKRHGVFHVLDARGFPVLRSRRLEDVLATLTK